MGNHYMNPSARGMNCSGRYHRYTGCEVCRTEAVSPRVCDMKVCDCTPATQNVVPCEGQVVAMAYVPMQTWGDVYEAEKGFYRGTLFADLDKPFMGGCRV